MPSGSDLPRTPSVPSNARTISLDEIGSGLQIGRILVRPPGSVPSKKDFERPSEGEVVRILLGRAESLQAQADALGVKLTHGTPPAGYQLVSGRVAAWVKTATGEARISAEEYGFQSPTQYNLGLYIATLADGGSMEVIAFADNTALQLSHKKIEDVDVVYLHNKSDSTFQATLRAHFVLGVHTISMDVVALPMVQFEAYVQQFIVEHKPLYESVR